MDVANKYNAENKENKENKESKESKESKEWRITALDSVPVVDLSSGSGNLFGEIFEQEETPTEDENPFSTDEQMAFRQSKHNIVMFDVEACHDVQGTVLAVAAVLGTYTDFMKYSVVRRQQWIIERTLNDCDPKTKKFWMSEGHTAWHFFAASRARVPEATAAKQIRQFISILWKWVPHLAVMVDSVYGDLTLLNNLLTKHNHKPLHWADEKYKYSIYVSRDLIRGFYAGIDPGFSRLHEQGLSKAIQECWKKLIGNGKRPFISGASHDIAAHGYAEKHFPVHDAADSLIRFFQTEDIRAYYETHYPRPTYNMPAQNTVTFVPFVRGVNGELYVPAHPSSMFSYPSHSSLFPHSS